MAMGYSILVLRSKISSFHSDLIGHLSWAFIELFLLKYLPVDPLRVRVSAASW